jgi:hypothetical protein
MTERTMTADEYRGYVNGIMEALIEVSKITGGMQIGDFNEKTWKMICQINARLSGMAADLDDPPHT